MQFAGDMNPASQPSEEWLALPEEERQRTFQAKPLWQRALIVFAGPATNLLVAILIYAGFAMAYGTPVAPPVIGSFAEDSVAAEAGLEVGDRIVAIDGERIDSFEEVAAHVLPFPGQVIEIEYEREGQVDTLPLRIADLALEDRFGNEARIGRIGIGSPPVEYRSTGPLEAVAYGGEASVKLVELMVTGLKQIIMGERSVKELGGPIKIAQYSGERMSLGALPFIEFIALISINLAFINLLPIPALDGGHLAFYAAEAVRRKPASLRSQEWAFRTGMAVVLALMVFVTINDIASLPVFR